MTAALATKSGSRGEIQDWYCQGLTGCSARIRSTEDTDRSSAVPARVSSASSSGPGQRDDRGPGQLADPPRPPRTGQVSEPVQAAGGEPAPPLTHRIGGDLQVR